MAKRLGILTGGGDCPGLNAVIRAVVRTAINQHEMECVGILRGWRGLIDSLTVPLTMDSISGLLPRGGTILRTSRTNPFSAPGAPQRVIDNVKKFDLDAIVVLGGNDTLGVASRFFAEHNLNVIGIPKTIDNDVCETEYSFGFDSTVNIAMEAIDRIHTTAESHDRVMIVEVMGRLTGWIAIYVGLASGADIILIPEKPFTIQDVCDTILHRHDRGKDFSIVVVAEGACHMENGGKSAQLVTQSDTIDEFGRVRLGGIGNVIGNEIEKLTGFQTRVTVLGHIQRGGTPTAFDRVLGTRFGVESMNLVAKGEFGQMVGLQGNHIVAVPLMDATAQLKTVPEEFYRVAKVFFG